MSMEQAIVAKFKRAAVVDDDADVRQVVTELLEAKGFIVNTAENGLNGLELVSRGSYDLIISDWEMPLMNGIELILELRAKGLTIPIILMTGRIDIDPMQVATAGASVLLKKPFSSRQLNSLLQNYFSV